jgi:hypothetical protein
MMKHVNYKFPIERCPDRFTFAHHLPTKFPKDALPFIKDAFKITFVREPYDRAASIYAYSTKGRRPFVEWFEEIERCHSKPTDIGRVFSPQYRWFEGITYDFVGRYETITEDIMRAKELINCPPVRFPHMNKSEVRKSTEKYYRDSKAVETIQRIYRKDFELLGYPM